MDFRGKCPICGSVTHYTIHDPDTTVAEILQETRQRKADRFYDLHCEKRKAMGYADPATIGRLEARRMIRQMRMNGSA
jgi:hypothetical protein